MGEAIDIRGKVWKFGDNIDTDVVIATQYLIDDIPEMKKHTFEIIRPEFANEFQEGDIIVGGKNFGCGSSREQAVDVLKELGVSAIIAKSFARIFFRNCLNAGIPVIECQDTDDFKEGDTLSIKILKDEIIIESGEREYRLPGFYKFMLEKI